MRGVWRAEGWGERCVEGRGIGVRGVERAGMG